MDEADGPASGDWASVRLAYTGGDPIEALAARFVVPQEAIAERVRQEDWRRRGRNRTDQRQTILDAMFRILERQLVEMETRLWARAHAEEKDNDMASKDMAALANMARTLEKLLEFEKVDPGARKPMTEKQSEELRAKLAKRIEQYLSD